MAEEIKVPAVGKVKRVYVIGGLAAIAGIVVYAYWRQSQAPVEEELPGEGDEWVTGDTWSPDAYVGADAPGGSTTVPVEGATPFTNAEWAQRVIDLLEGAQVERGFAAATVGKYLSGQPLTAAEKIVIQTAIALLGNPPAGALPIISAPTPVTPTPTTPPASNKLATPTGLRLTVNRRGYFEFVWNRVPGTTYYGVKKERPGRSIGPTTTAKKVGRHREKKGMTFWYRVQAHAPGKLPSNWSAPLIFKAA
jgi:hypothetical protein